jgi:hypothetical protein
VIPDSEEGTYEASQEGKKKRGGRNDHYAPRNDKRTTDIVTRNLHEEFEK